MPGGAVYTTFLKYGPYFRRTATTKILCPKGKGEVSKRSQSEGSRILSAVNLRSMCTLPQFFI